MYANVIEKPLGCKVKLVRYVRSPSAGRSRADGPRLESAQDARRRRLQWYRKTHGRAILWPSLVGDQS